VPGTGERRFLTGTACFTADLTLARLVHACFLRSPHAHALVRRVDVARAERAPGVIAVFTGADVQSLGLGSIPCVMHPEPLPGTSLVLPPRWPLAVDKVRHVGEPVAMVVADEPERAKDALELVEVEYQPLPSVVDVAEVGGDGAPIVHDQAPENVCVRWAAGDAARTQAALAGAHHVTRLEVHNNRLVANPLETRAAIGDYEPGIGRFTLYSASQGAHELRAMLAAHVLHVPDSALRVVTPDVGGSFGLKMYVYPEQVMVLVAARALGRPVKWVAERIEAFVADNHGRDQVSVGELGLASDGRFLALRVKTTANMGAYLAGYGPYIPTVVGSRALIGPYLTPCLHVEVEAVFTHTAPVDAYRGAGRPEATFLVERLVDTAARELGLDPVELRRRNLIPPQAMPYRTPLGLTYDSGDFARVLEDSLALAQWSGFRERRREAEARGRLRGIGLGFYVEPAGGERDQRAYLRFQPDGHVTVLMGTQCNGMGHETVFAQMVVDALGVSRESVRVVDGDTDVVPYGRWTSGSRGLVTGGSALALALERVIGKAKRIAAVLLAAAEDELDFADGAFRARNTNRAVTFPDVVRAAFDPAKVPEGLDLGLDQGAAFRGDDATFPNGCHVCEVEVDPESGETEVVRYVAVDDFGRVVAPMLVDGQVHGGVAQGIGQALYEHCLYDGPSGQLLTASFLDYCLPRATDLPFLTLGRHEVPCRTNPLGAKGCGEAGAIAAPPAVVNAIVDALAPLGVRHLDMPATPQRVWEALRRGRRNCCPS